MAWELKKEYKSKSIDSIRMPLDDLTQKQIEGLRKEVRDKLFTQEKKKKKNVDIKREI